MHQTDFIYCIILTLWELPHALDWLLCETYLAEGAEGNGGVTRQQGRFFTACKLSSQPLTNSFRLHPQWASYSCEFVQEKWHLPPPPSWRKAATAAGIWVSRPAGRQSTLTFFTSRR